PAADGAVGRVPLRCRPADGGRPRGRADRGAAAIGAVVPGPLRGPAPGVRLGGGPPVRPAQRPLPGHAPPDRRRPASAVLHDPGDGRAGPADQEGAGADDLPQPAGALPEPDPRPDRVRAGPRVRRLRGGGTGGGRPGGAGGPGPAAPGAAAYLPPVSGG